LRSLNATRVAHATRSTGMIISMRLRLAVLVAAAVPLGLVLGLAPSALAAAAGSWQAPTVLSSLGQESVSPAIAVDSRGDSVTAWLNRYGFNWDIDASTRAAGGEWQQPSLISTPGDIGFHPEVAIDSHGDAIVVWCDGDTEQVEAAIHRAGGEWEAPVAISAVAENEHPEVAVDASGDAVVVWDREQSGGNVVQAVVGSLQSGMWSEPVDLSTPAEAAGNPQVAVDSQGEATVVWQSYGEGDYYIQGVTGSIGHGTWGEPADLSVAGQVAANPQVAVNDAGETVVVWEWGGIELTPYTVQGAVRLADGQWGAPVNLSAGGVNGADFPNVAVDTQGDAVAVWEIREGRKGTAQSAVWTAATEAWQAPVDLSATGGKAGSPQVAVDPQGDAIAVWSGEGVQGAVLPADGQWGPPFDISPGSFGPKVAMDEAGNAVGVWDNAAGATQSASYVAGSEQQPRGEEPVSPSGEESERSGAKGSEVSAGSDLASAKASEEPGGKEAKAPIASKLRPASARSQCATAASKRTGKKALAASHSRHRGTNGCVARVRTVHHARRSARAGT